MSLKKVVVALMMIIIPLSAATIVSIFGPGDDYDLVSGFLLTLICVFEILAFFLAYCYIFNKEHGPRVIVLCSITMAILSLHGNIYGQRNSYKGGDINATAYLQGKTTSAGGYNYLLDTDTYDTVVTQEKFLQLPFSRYKYRSHIPSVARVENCAISASFPNNHYGPGSAIATLTLDNAIVHIPFDKDKVGRFFAQHEYRNQDVASLVAGELENLTRSKFSSMKYPPGPGSFSVEITDPQKALGYLHTEYGFEIVTEKNKRPVIVVTISYPPSAHYQL